MSNQTITLEVRCGYCAGKVRVEFRDWDQPGGNEPAVWQCPYCEVTNRLPAFGRVVQVEKMAPNFKPELWRHGNDRAVVGALPPRRTPGPRMRRGS